MMVMLKEFCKGNRGMERINSIYLIIAKVLANRLCEVIGELVEPFQ